MVSPERLALPHVLSLTPYIPGAQPPGAGWIKLNTNECPYPPSPLVDAAIASEIERLRLYPDSRADVFRKAVATYHGVDVAQVIAGNGSDDLLNLLVRAFSGPGKPAGMNTPSYTYYANLAAFTGQPIVEIPLGPSMVPDLAPIVESNVNLFFLCSPHAPSGVAVPRAIVADLARAFSGLLVVDEAYAGFADDDAIPLLCEFPRLVVVRTLSKSHALAGLRVGYALAHPDVIRLLDVVRDFYNLDRLAIAGAAAAMSDAAYYQAIRATVRQTRSTTLDSLRARGFATYESQANFVFTEPRRPTGECGAQVARGLFDFLETRKILVRHFRGDPRTEGHLRITIGTPEDMVAMVSAIDDWLR
jgi:histidinol-phosphate aminotransferase